jgi:DNA-binding CsgD family transcriptional regulator
VPMGGMTRLEAACNRTGDDVPDSARRRTDGRSRRVSNLPPPSPSARRLLHAVAATWAIRYRLTGAERTILAGTLLGMDRVALAAELEIRPGTLRRHVQNLIAKTGDASLDATVIRALREVIEQQVGRG